MANVGSKNDVYTLVIGLNDRYFYRIIVIITIHCARTTEYGIPSRIVGYFIGFAARSIN